MTTPRIIVGLPEWNLNGVCVFSANLVRGLVARGLDARLFITEEHTPLVDYPRVGHPLPDDIAADRLRLTAHDRWSEAWMGIERYLEEHGPCVYIPNHDFRASCMTPRLSPRVTVVGMIHADNRLEYEHVSRLARHWHAVVAVNPAIRRRAAMEMPWLASRLAVIPIGVALPEGVPARVPSATLRLVYHGELRMHQKRVLDLVAVLELLVARGTGVCLTLIGDGPARSDIETRGHGLIASGHLVLHGALPHTETLAALGAHDVYVLASEFEGTPNAMLEAMARGCIPVVSDIDTLAGIVQHGENGLRFPAGDIAAFAGAIERLAADRAAREDMARAAARTVHDGPYSLDAMLDAWTALLARVARDERRPVRPRARASVPPATMGGVSILPGRFEGSMRLANRVTMWPAPPIARRVHATTPPHVGPLGDHRIVLAATSGRISGVDVFSVHLVRALVARGFRAEILVSRADEPTPDPLPFPADVPVRTLAVTPSTSWRRRWALLRRELESRGPAIYVPNYDWRHSGIVPTLAASVKVVGVVHSDDPQHYEHALRLGDSWNAIVAVSDAIAREVAALSPAFAPRLSTIPYGVPMPRRGTRGARTPGPLRIVYAGRLARHQKRALDLPCIADALSALGVEFELVVVGAGPDQTDFLRVASAHLVTGSIRYVGSQPNDAVLDLFSRADVFVLPSSFEGLPVSMLEAMAHGAVPVVSDVRSGVREVIRDGTNGFLVPVGDVGCFAERIALLARDPARLACMSASALASVEAGPYSVEAMCDAYVGLFERVAATPFGRPISGVRPPADLSGMRAWLPPELPTMAQVQARVRQSIRGLGGR